MRPNSEDGREDISHARESVLFWEERFRTYGHTGFINALIYSYDQPLRMLGVTRVLKWAGIAPLRGLQVLDVGCGTGDVVLALAQGGARVTGIDHAKGVLVTARNRVRQAGLEALFVEARVENPPFAPGTFDLATSVTVLQHLVDEEGFCSGVKGMAQVLKDRGHILLLEIAPGNIENSPSSLPHLRIRSRDSWVRSFEEVGCHVVKEVEVPQIGLAAVRGLRKFGWPTRGRLSARSLMLVMRTALRLTLPLDRALLGFPLIHSNYRFMVFRKGEG